MILLLIFLLFISGCQTTKISQNNLGVIDTQITQNVINDATPQNSTTDRAKEQKLKESTITLLFAGDVMAHRPNYQMQDYNKIWEGVKGVIKSADLSFCNIEAPVCDEIPYSTYPNFNMHSDYTKYVIDAGFNVFSLCNNHTNDQGLAGIESTMKWAEECSTLNAAGIKNNNELYFSGLHKKSEQFSYCLIKKNGWKILFVAAVEILNRPDYASLMNYYPYNNSGREQFTAYVKKLREKNPCDIFVVSIHCDDAEYVEEVTARRANYYRQLLASGVDVIWGNHPHIIRERSLVSDSTGVLRKVIMYGCGNTISAQRTDPQFNSPNNARDRTGDGIFFEVTYSKNILTESDNDGTQETNNTPIKNNGEYEANNISENASTISEKPFIKKTVAHYITTYKSPAGYVIKPLNNEFVKELEKTGDNKWVQYIKERIKIVESTKESIIVE